MKATSIGRQRLGHQRLSANPFEQPEEVVAWLGAVQAQDYAGGKWALALRMRDAGDDAVEQAFTTGAILRTHVMRPTWHFVTPSDIRWLLELTASRVNTVNASLYRQLELDDALFSRSNAVIAKALAGGRFLTRAELGRALAEAGIAAEGLRLTCLVMRAELDAVVCSGPRRGKQFTYALLDERAPQARRLARDEALTELTQRYFTGHGPATIRDFAWWSGLTVADAKAGVATVAETLNRDVVDGETYWFSPSNLPAEESPGAVFLLPTYDEFLVGFAAFGKSLRGGLPAAETWSPSSPIVIDGRVAGSWRRTFQKGSVVIELAPFAPLTAEASEAVAAAAPRYGKHLGMPAVLSVPPHGKGAGG